MIVNEFFSWMHGCWFLAAELYLLRILTEADLCRTLSLLQEQSLPATATV